MQIEEEEPKADGGASEDGDRRRHLRVCTEGGWLREREREREREEEREKEKERRRGRGKGMSRRRHDASP